MRERNEWRVAVNAAALTSGAGKRFPVATVDSNPKGATVGRAAVTLLLLSASLSLTTALAVLTPATAARAQEDPATRQPPPPPDSNTVTPPPDGPVVPQGPKGRIRIFVRDAVSKFLLNDAAVFIDDPTLNELRSLPFYVGDVNRKDEGGQPLAGPGYVISDELAAHQWTIVALKEGYQTGRALVTVLPNQEVTVTVYLRLRERIEPFILLSTRDTTNSTKRTLEFARSVPYGAINRQEVNSIIASTPGFVRNSLGQVHPRGQRFGIATSLDGFLLPSQPTGQLQGTIPQDVIQTYDIKHGGLSAEFGGDVGVAANLTTRSIGSVPFVEGDLAVGNYGTFESYLTIAERFSLRGNRALAASADRQQAALDRSQNGPILPGAAVPAPGSRPVTGPTFGYMLHLNKRVSDLAAELPQSSRNTANNKGENTQVFGKFELVPNARVQVTGIYNRNDARTGIGNRTRNGGVGYLGLTASPAEANSLLSQQQSGQDQFQKENNSLSLLQIRRLIRPKDSILNPDSTLTISVGGVSNELRLESHSTRFDPRDLTDPTSPLYRANSSIEFNPNIRRNYDQLQSQADLVIARGPHILKAGLLANFFSNSERYQFEPGSQIALDALFARSPLLVPATVVPDQAGRRDILGNQIVHYADGRPANAPASLVRRDGTYTAIYLQDTWSMTQALTINGGFRLDDYSLSAVGANQALRIPGQRKIDVNEVSPRLNMAYQMGKRGLLGFLGGTGIRKAVFRVSYDRLFQRPPLGQGAYFSSAPVRPQIGDEYEVSFEKQLGKDRLLKLTSYSIDFENFLDVASLFPGAQFGTGPVVLVNYPKAKSEGFEVSYAYNPNFRESNPFSWFASYANGSIKLRSRGRLDSLGRVITDSRASFDQRDTINVGASVKLDNGSTFGISSYIGSGLYGSRRTGSDKRDAISEVNVKFSTHPRLFGNLYGADFAVENLFDQKGRYNFFGDFEGSRYQVGRRFIASIYARF